MSIVFPGFFTVPDGFLSPMEGVMTSSFAAASDRWKLTPFWIPPFISVTGGNVPSAGVLKKRLRPFTDTGDPVIPQILGKDSLHLLHCTEHLLSIGFRGINLNLCCPSPAVTSHGAGAALLADPGKAGALAGALKKEFPELNLSIKIRSGWEHENTAACIQTCTDNGADWIIYHFRTGKEMYSPVSDRMDRMEKALRAAGKTPICGNGDIRNPEEARQLLEHGFSACAAARGFLADPDLIRRICGQPAAGVTSGMFRQAMAEADSPLSQLKKMERMIRELT